MTKPINEILPKEIEEGLDELLSNFSKLIDEFVNYGTHILKWIVQKPDGSDEQMPLILFFRDLLEKADSISLLIDKSSIDPSKIILRSIFEIHLYIDYLTEKDYEDRAMSFLVWDKMRKLRLLNSFKKDTEQYKQLLAQLRKDKSILGTDILENIPDVKEKLKNIEKLLKREEYRKAVNEYNRTKEQDNKNPSWYRLFNGPINIKELAEKQEMSFLYEVLYREWSGSVHGTDVFQGKVIPSNIKELDSNLDKVFADIIQIRFPKDSQRVTSYCLLLLLKSFRLVVNFKAPEKVDNLKNWYLTVRQPLMEVTSKNNLINIK